MNKSVLRDGSTILRFTRLELSFIPKVATVILAEAITSKGETVIVSCGTPGYIGRSEGDYPADQFHLLDGRYMFPYWALYEDSHLNGVAIDENDEVWILFSPKDQHYASFCPDLPKESNVEKPTKTNLMKDANCKALNAVTYDKILALTVIQPDCESSRILLLNSHESLL